MRSPAIRPILKLSVCILISISLNGCANLEEIRDFSKQSAAITASTQAFDYELQWKERKAEYTSISKNYPAKSDGNGLKAGSFDVPKANTLELNEAEIKSVRSVHTTLANYMLAISALADDSAIETNSKVDELVKDLNEFPLPADEAERKKRNEAYGAILKLIKLPLEAWRQYELRQVIIEADPDITTLTNLLSLQTANMAHRINTEGREVDSWYARRVSDYPAESFVQAVEGDQARKARLTDTTEKYNAAIASSEAIAKFGTIHHQMAEDLGTFNTRSVKTLISNIKTARLEVEKARDQYKNAFKGE